MKVLFPQDVPTLNPGNPYVLQLMDALIHQPEVSNVGAGGVTLYWPKPKWDVIHIQWPEALFGWKEPTPDQIQALGSTLEQAKRHASIVVTIHNYNPREWMGPIGHQLYKTVYERADAFVHLGQRSLEWFLVANSGCDWCTSALHEVIEHGDYRFYNLINQDASLVPPSASDTTNFLVFGTMRWKEEISFAESAFRQAGLPSAKLIFAGKTEPGAKLGRASADPNIIRYHQRVADAQVKPLVQASEFVFLPRSGRLNSGVIPLAFTFDTPVIAPNEGVVGEIVEATKNISFISGDSNSAAEALRSAYFLSSEEYQAMSRRVRVYRENKMDWPNLARQHLALYERALGLHPHKPHHAARV